MTFEGRVVVITGGGRGIGAATARLFAEQGARVVIASRTPRELDHMVSVIGSDRCMGVVADVSKEKDVRHLFNEAIRRFDKVDVLVHAAGAVIVKPFASLKLEEWEQVIGANLTSAFLCSRELFRRLSLSQTPGSIVLISSLAGIRGTEKFPGLSAYVAAKHGVAGLTEALAVEGKPLKIRVNCVAPGAVDTQMLREAAPFLKTETRPEDIGQIILTLCDDSRSHTLSGSIIEVHSNA